MKNSFGGGLESLIPKKVGEIKEISTGKTEAVFSIEIEKIKSNPYQPRKEFSQEGLDALANSIRDYGVLQPLLVSRVRKEEGQVEYQLIAGERRLLASKIAGLNQVPVIIKEPTDKEKLEVSIIENVQRLDLNAIEKAVAFKRLQDEFNFLQKDIARLCGRSRESVANTMRLLELPEEIRQAVRENKISEGHARAILMAKEPEKQKVLFSLILKDGLSVRKAEDFVQKLAVWQPKQKTVRFMEEFKDFEDKFIQALGTKNLKFGMEAGQPKLTIYFKTKSEIEGLLKKFF